MRSVHAQSGERQRSLNTGGKHRFSNKVAKDLDSVLSSRRFGAFGEFQIADRMKRLHSMVL